MAYEIRNAGGFDFTLEGKRIPARETRATEASAIKRARAQIEKQGGTSPKETRLHGMVVISDGPARKFIVEPA